MLVVGGRGAFGARLVTGLLRSTPFAVIVAGRDAAQAAAFVRGHAEAARLTALALDARSVTPEALRATGAFAVVDAAGPYQGGDYRLAQAAIGAGLAYLDLADARDFVAGFAALNASAQAAGVVALTGVSSTPALSNAVLDDLTAGWRAVDRVEIAIMPGNRAPRGLSVVRSILSYAGRPVRVFHAGRWQTRPGWGMTVRQHTETLGARWLALAETPDLDIVPARFAVRDSVVFRAGLELSVLHLGLLLASLPVRLRRLRSLAPWARPLRWFADLLIRCGSDRGGMTVVAEGLDARGLPIRGRWWLIAEAGDGPFVPTLPVLAALRALTDGSELPTGARACAGVLTYAQIAAEFSGLRIMTGRRCEHPPPGLYETVLGAAFHDLPEAVQRLHRPGWRLRLHGMARVEGADGFVAGCVAAVFRFPRAADGVPVAVTITAIGGRERWERNFGGRRFASMLAAAGPGRVSETFGAFRFVLDLPVGRAGVLGMPIRAWRVAGLRLPRRLAPVSLVSETVDPQGRFQFDVELRLPLGLGRLVRYRGWLIP